MNEYRTRTIERPVGVISRAAVKSTVMNSVEVFRGMIKVRFGNDRKVIQSLTNLSRSLGIRDNLTKDGCLKFPLDQALKVAVALRGMHFEWSEAALKAISEAAHENRREKGLDHEIEKRMGILLEPMPDGKILKKHQVEGVQWMLRNRRAIVGDDMGLGKTLQSCVASKILHEITGETTVVVCPANIRGDWVDQMHGVGHKSFRVISWAKLKDFVEEWVNLKKRSFVFIADEAHYAKNSSSVRGKAFLEMAKWAKSIFILTGTPVKNAKPMELFPLLKAIGLPLARTKSGFEKRFCAGHMKEIPRKGGEPIRIWDNNGKSNLDDLHLALKPIVLRRMKSECLDLPEKTRQVIKVDLSKEQQNRFMSLLRESKRTFDERVSDGKASRHGAALAAMTAMRMHSSQIKIDETVRRAKEIISEGNKVLIFTEYVESANEIARQIGVRPHTGQIPINVRKEMVREFQEGMKPAFVSTIAAGGVGLTLTEASYVILHDRALTPGDCDQAEDRAHRQGQRNAVTVYWIQAFPIDERVDEILEDKRKDIKLIMEGKSEGESKPEISAQLIANEMFKLT